eukprot:scaffold119218_cov66-Phaeocystis_antarctica.AAC.2
MASNKKIPLLTSHGARTRTHPQKVRRLREAGVREPAPLALSETQQLPPHDAQCSSSPITATVEVGWGW